jgi:hypothetical protein
MNTKASLFVVILKTNKILTKFNAKGKPMKLALVSFVLLLAPCILAQDAPAQQSSAQDDSTATPTGFAALLGYKSVPVKQTFSHNTNPGDNFLPNANVPGSVGTTSLDQAQFIDVGLRYEMPIKKKWRFNIDATGLFAVTTGNGADASGMNLDDRQNANDNRPAANAAFIYTDANWGFDVALGITYSLPKNFYVGAVADLSGVFVDSGWDRYSSYTSQSTKLVLVPAGGPKLGWRMSENIAIEGTALFGKNGVGYNAGLVWNF